MTPKELAILLKTPKIKRAQSTNGMHFAFTITNRINNTY